MPTRALNSCNKTSQVYRYTCKSLSLLPTTHLFYDFERQYAYLHCTTTPFAPASTEAYANDLCQVTCKDDATPEQVKAYVSRFPNGSRFSVTDCLSSAKDHATSQGGKTATSTT